jgi:hypothetical protein
MKNGNFVDVEIWKEQLTGDLVKIVRCLHIHGVEDSNYKKIIADVDKRRNKDEFEKWLDEERKYLEEYVGISNNIEMFCKKSSLRNRESRESGRTAGYTIEGSNGEQPTERTQRLVDTIQRWTANNGQGGRANDD